MADETNDVLEGELRRLLQRVDPVPPEVTAAGRAAIGWRRLDADLAELLADSALDPEPVGVRGRGVRTSRYSSGELEIDVEIHYEDDRMRLVGQLDPGSPATVEVQDEDGVVTAMATADDLGRFRVEFYPVSRARLRVIREGSPVVESSWLAL